MRTGRHVGTVNLGRRRLLATHYEQQDLIRALPGWISQAQDEERSAGVPSHQLWRGIPAAFTADVAIGWQPQPAAPSRLTATPWVAPARSKAALCGRGGDGWGHRDRSRSQVGSQSDCGPDRLPRNVPLQPETGHPSGRAARPAAFRVTDAHPNGRRRRRPFGPSGRAGHCWPCCSTGGSRRIASASGASLRLRPVVPKRPSVAGRGRVGDRGAQAI